MENREQILLFSNIYKDFYNDLIKQKSAVKNLNNKLKNSIAKN